MGSLVELGGVKETTDRDLDALTDRLSIAESENTSIVNLGLDEGVAVEVELGTNLKSNGALGGGTSSRGSLGVPDSLSTSLEISVDAVIVRGREDLERVVGVESHGILRGSESCSCSEAGDVGSVGIVSNITSDRETITTNNDISSESWSLEEIDVSARVDAQLLVLGTDLGVLLAIVGEVASSDIDLQALGSLVLNLDLGGEMVTSGPCLGDSQAVLVVDILGLELTGDVTSLVVLVTKDVEGNVVGGDGLELELGLADGEVLGEEIVGGLAEISEGDGNGGGHGAGSWIRG